MNSHPSQPVSQIEPPSIGTLAPRIPRIRLDMDAIPDMMAAKLATSLLGHVLFLKNQVPFPVLQLARLPNGKSNARATKLKRDLIDSYDTLSSHLDTTFTALSTAFARCSRSSASDPSIPQTLRSQAFMAIIVGPSIGTAKSKVMFAVDGLEAKIWGLRDDLPRTVVRDEGDSDCSDEAEDSDPEEAEDESCEPEDFDCPSEPEDSDAEGDNSDVASSRSSTSSRRSSPTPPPSTPSERIHVSKSISSSVQDHASQQQKIRTADQLLSRTLAIADAEGRGMATELAPTQTHILLRAPRRFSHPAWIPRPNFTKSLEHTLNDFLEETQVFVNTLESEAKPKLQRIQKQKIEGVWVTGRTSSDLLTPESISSQRESESEDHDEEDEMIWWSWDGKMVGFSSW
ncbi:hypothetical protein BDP27DRAFT_1214101 [Rhodocollybia butyracea]|uniref:Uncharacterized protein n=1 Tax=Rhodocollybia butyracea TaxID=206335 RepID=A0A9P5Q382_9AGAR|nr:hypothetical protein BDP27DRAFT_1214101 [Rhodocollybia butyracea]